MCFVMGMSGQDDSESLQAAWSFLQTRSKLFSSLHTENTQLKRCLLVPVATMSCVLLWVNPGLHPWLLGDLQQCDGLWRGASSQPEVWIKLDHEHKSGHLIGMRSLSHMQAMFLCLPAKKIKCLFQVSQVINASKRVCIGGTTLLMRLRARCADVLQR